MQKNRDALHGCLERFDRKNGLLGRHARSLHYLQIEIHGVGLVAFERNLQQRFNVQRLHHSALFSKSGNRFVFA